MSFQRVPDEEEEKKKQNEGTKKSNKEVENVEAQANKKNNNSYSKKRKQKEFAPFGNYRNYYGYRIGHDMEGDPRLKVFKKEWFEGKDCLDIGCNSGIITIQIAKIFHCCSILGVDIDSDRIQEANWNLRRTLRKYDNKHPNASKSEVTGGSNGLEDSVNASLDEEARVASKDYSAINERNLCDIVSFQTENFVQSVRPLPRKYYDTIICLSVTKWVHLNWGDEGVITLFTKIWKLLQPGGILVLEPQPWRSYESNRHTSETTAATYRNIMFPPDHFQDMLIDKIGFKTVEDVTSGLSGSKTGFNRPILAFQK